MATPNAEYWARRMKTPEDALLDQGYDYAQNLETQFDRATAQIEKDLAAWYQRFADNNGITYAEAQKWLTADELKEFHWTVEDYIKYAQDNELSGAWVKRLENASARVHISRLDALKLELQQQAERLAGGQLDGFAPLTRRIYTQGYYKTAFEIQRGIGIGWTLHALNEDTIAKVLSRPWTTDGLTFTDRVWTNKDALVGSVNQHLTQMIIRGENPRKTIDALAHDMNVSKGKAGRLVMTESAYFSSAAQKDCFNSLGVERFTVVAALDSDTCPVCGAMDGKVFKMSEYAEGLTAPPFHPWCRCCTAPYFDDMQEMGERAARDADGKSITVPRNTTFAEWKNGYVQPAAPLSAPPSGGTISVADAQQTFSSTVRGQTGMTQGYGNALEQRFSAGSGTAKDAFAKLVGPGSIDDSAYIGTPHFNRATQKVSMDFANDAANPRGAGTTFFHEHGHYIDFLSCPGVGYTSTKTADFGDLLRSDFDRYIKAFMKSKKVNKTGAYSLVSQELQWTLTHSVSDLCGGLSKNKCVGSYGHWKTAYWSNPGAVEKEAFAHMFEAQFNADKYALMQKYFPDALKEFERLLAEVVK